MNIRSCITVKQSCPIATMCIKCFLEPKMGDLNNIVVPKVSAQWEDIAYQLGYEIPKVNEINAKHKEDPKKCCKELFKDWLMSDGVRPKIWQTLLDKLKKTEDLYAITEAITEELIQMDSEA